MSLQPSVPDSARLVTRPKVDQETYERALRRAREERKDQPPLDLSEEIAWRRAYGLEAGETGDVALARAAGSVERVARQDPGAIERVQARIAARVRSMKQS